MLWVGGIDIRAPILAIPPLLPLLHRSLPLDEKAVGLLTGLPVLLFASMSVAGALLISRLGARRALIAGLATVAIAGALRGAGPSLPVLFGATLVMSAGVALIQPAFPTLVREWLPSRAVLGTAAFANGMLIGETVAAVLTAGLATTLLGGNWALALAVWSVPVAILALVVLVAVPHRPPVRGLTAARWWPDWRNRRTWKLGLILGGGSLLYWWMSAFIPDYLDVTGRHALVVPALGALNAAQLISSVLVAAVPGIVGRQASFVVCALALGLATIGFLLLPGLGAVIAAGAVGMISAIVFVLALSLPPMLTTPDDVHRLSAAMFTITYGCAFLGPVLGGAAWDLTRNPTAAFAAPALAVAMMIVLAIRLDLPPGLARAIR